MGLSEYPCEWDCCLDGLSVGAIRRYPPTTCSAKGAPYDFNVGKTQLTKILTPIR